MRFTARQVRFGRRVAGSDEDQADELPTPQRVKLLARRAAGIREATETLAYLPAAGESLHCLMTARLDMTDVVNVLLGKLGRCETAYIATLGYNRRNFHQMLEWLDAGKIGSLTLLASIFFRSHNGDLWAETVEQFLERGQHAACCPSHCKVMALAFADGTRLAIEGSANLCSNASAREQFCIVNDTGLRDFHATWIAQMVKRHEAHENDTETAA